MLYAFTENFTLPISHDEVVHGKGPMYDKMPGDNWQKCANLRLYYTYMYMHPGKKLLFMGNEFGVTKEWNYADSLDWSLLQYHDHKTLHHFMKTLNKFYVTHKELSDLDFDGAGFEWIDGSDASQSCFSFMRKDKEGNALVIACNFTPVPRYDYKIGVNEEGEYEEVFNSDASEFGGSGVLNTGTIQTGEGWNFKPYALRVTLPPLATVVYQLKKKR
jgi:1,4-alpha-glucan branching enzyme